MTWLDPMPLPADLGKAYTTYYTHTSHAKPVSGVKEKKSKFSIQGEYWAKQYGYPFPRAGFLIRAASWLYYLWPISRWEADAGIRCLRAVPNGRLLDVGCGSGDWLLTMREFGWQVAGNDFDRQAVHAAGEKGLQVNLGSLEDQHLPDNSFDAITLHHVIEHLPDPIQTLKECFRILRPGGKLILFTPNCESLSHSLFKSDWRGLEPPRHLHIFSLGSMAQLLLKAGFKDQSVRPFIVTSVIYDSLQLRWSRTGFTKKRSYHWLGWGCARIFKLVELLMIRFNPKVGDCLIATAVKPQ